MLIGHDAALEQICKSFKKDGRWHHAWLLYGNHSSGKSLLARTISTWLLNGGHNNNSSPTKVNTEVFNRICSHNHPDSLIIESAKDIFNTGKKNQIITIQEIREATQFAQRTPLESELNILIIDAAEEMNVNAANAILKILEEPPLYTVIFIISHNIAKVLPTIRSRCSKIFVPNLSFQEFCRILQPKIGAATNSLFSDAETDSDLKELYEFTDGSIAHALFIHQTESLEILKNLLNNTYQKEDIAKIIQLCLKDRHHWHINAILLLKVFYQISYRPEYQPKSFKLVETFQKLLYDVNILNLDLEASLRNFFTSMTFL